MKGCVAAIVVIIAGVTVAGTNSVCTVKVHGEVAQRGTYSMTNAPINTLGQLLERFGKPLTYANVRGVRVLRHAADGKTQTNTVNAAAWATGDVQTITFPLRDGDEVVIPARRLLNRS